MIITCARCGCKSDKPNGAVNRARKIGAPVYCDKNCAGFARKVNKAREQKKEDKRLYDAEYRAKNRALLKVKKANYFQRTYDPAKAAQDRKLRMPAHIEYCRTPEYRAWKKAYDRRYRGNKLYGEYGEAFSALLELENEVLSRMSRYDIDLMNGKLNKRKQRRREYENLISNKS